MDNTELKYNIKAYPELLNDLSSYDLDQDVMNRLSLHLMRTYQGNSDVYRTPIAKLYGEERILSDLDEVFNANKHILNSVLIDLEISNRDKFGPRSIAKPWSERLEALSEGFGFGQDDISIEMAPTSRSILRPISLQKSIQLLKNNTNSGLPYYTRKSKVKQRAYDEYGDLVAKQYPCILFTRTQEQRKTRDVWGYPMADTMNESRFYYPLLSYQRKLDYRSALNSPDEVAAKITSIITKCNQRINYIIVSMDFTTFDKSVKYLLQKAAFNYIKDLYQDEYSQEIDDIFNRFNSIGLVTPTKIMKGQHQIPSGSPFTNEVDSIVQVAVAKSSGLIMDGEFQVQGDDGVYLIPASEKDKFFEVFRKAGLIINEDKSYSSDNYAIYLQSLFHIDYMKEGFIGGIYPIYRALNRILFQERWSTFEDYDLSGKDYYSIRTLSILENCKYHPLFREFVKLVLKYDKYSLDPSDQGISKYIKMMSETEGAGEVLNQQYGNNISGIRNFASYKLVRELS